MTIDFDDLGGGFVDEEYRDPRVPYPLGLVVAEKADSGEAMHEEERRYHYSTAGLPMVIFIGQDGDDPEREVFGNARAYADAMGRVSLPTEEEARAWERRVIFDRLAARE